MHDVFGIVVTEHARRMAVQGTLDLECESLEGTSVTAARAIEEHTARFPEFLPHQRRFASL